MTKSRRRALALALLAVAVVCCAVTVVLWRQQVSTPDGAICGSAWHYRPGHGEPSGGFQDAGERAAGAQRCRQAAAPPFGAGLASLGLAAVCVLTSAILALSGRARTTSGAGAR